jgi:hypothetical protein
VTAESDNKYESENEICEKCNCTDSNTQEETHKIFTIDCSKHSLENIFSEWPKDLSDSYKGNNLKSFFESCVLKICFVLQK